MKIPDELMFLANARKPQKHTDTRLDGKVCVLTGATSGVGLASAKRLAKGGANLILVNRNLQKAEFVQSEIQENYNVSVKLITADFSDLQQVHDAANSILDVSPQIDILINNAGVHNTNRILTKEGFETVFCVNHLASFLLTSLLLERIRESSPARIIQINSQGHRFGGFDIDDLNWERRRYRGLQAYGGSKIAQLLTVWEFADQLAGSGVTINAMHPGEVATNIGMNNGGLLEWYQRHILFPMLKGPDTSAEAVYYLAAAPEMSAVSGKYFNLTIEEKPAAYTHALDRQLGKKVWEISRKLTGLCNNN